MNTTTIMRIIPQVQALNLVGHNLSYTKKKKKKLGDIFNLGTTNLVGIGLIQSQSDLIE